MTRVDIVALPSAPHQLAPARALANGLRRHGVPFRLLDKIDDATADIVACWGWRNAQVHAARACVLVMELGYVGDRQAWTSLGWNGLNGRAQFPAVNDGGARWRRHFEHLMHPGRRIVGAYTLVLGQVAGDAALGGRDLQAWYTQAAACLPGPRRFRPHPVELARRGAPAAVCGMPVLTGPLEEALAGAACAVGFNSNALTDAALAGVPIIACDEGAMAWPVAGHGLTAQPALGDREPWAHRLAWCQWSLEEMASGEVWAALEGGVKPWN